MSIWKEFCTDFQFFNAHKLIFLFFPTHFFELPPMCVSVDLPAWIVTPGACRLERIRATQHRSFDVPSFLSVQYWRKIIVKLSNSWLLGEAFTTLFGFFSWFMVFVLLGALGCCLRKSPGGLSWPLFDLPLVLCVTRRTHTSQLFGLSLSGQFPGQCVR